MIIANHVRHCGICRIVSFIMAVSDCTIEAAINFYDPFYPNGMVGSTVEENCELFLRGVVTQVHRVVIRVDHEAGCIIHWQLMLQFRFRPNVDCHAGS